jgi:hypothetical protein
MNEKSVKKDKGRCLFCRCISSEMGVRLAGSCAEYLCGVNNGGDDDDEDDESNDAREGAL